MLPPRNSIDAQVQGSSRHLCRPALLTALASFTASGVEPVSQEADSEEA